jgi:hypothetical protein
MTGLGHPEVLDMVGLKSERVPIIADGPRGIRTRFMQQPVETL